MTLVSYLRVAPKAELHVHLEGSILPDTLLALAQRNRVALPVESVAEMREWFRFRDFAHFIDVYLAIGRCLRTREDYELIVLDFGREMARQHVRYAEVTFTPSDRTLTGIPYEVWFGGLCRGRERVRDEFGVAIAWVFDIARGPMDETRAGRCDYTTGAAIDGMRDGVVALGLGGSEDGHPPEHHERWFEKARAAGPRSVPHAGEHAGPESVWGALTALGAERIEHGVRSIDDPTLVAYLAKRRIALDVCPTSNLRLGVYPDLACHPLPRLLAAGVPLTINSDDPPLFGTTLNEEVELLATGFGLDVAVIDELLMNGIRYSFLPPERKRALEAEFRAECTALKAAHLSASEA